MKRFHSLIILFLLIPLCNLMAAENLIKDPSFELTKSPDQFGLPFVDWSGWKYEGETEFGVGKVFHSGKSSGLLIGKSSPKIRISQQQELKPGRYRVTAYLRGLDIGFGQWNQTTEFMFNNQYMQLDKNGTFGWTKITYVGEVLKKEKVAVSFGLMATGFLWIDDVTLEEVAEDIPLTIKPLLGIEESSINPPGPIIEGAVKCPFCGNKNMLAWELCYACGTHLEANQSIIAKPPIKLISSFEENNPFNGGTIVNESFIGKKALQIDKAYVSIDSPQDWAGYDYLKLDLYTEANEPTNINIEIMDTATKDYWTRVNYSTMIPNGNSILTIPLKQLYVGEKSRPGRELNLTSITKFIMNIGDNTKAPVYLSKIWLENDDSLKTVMFDQLYAFDFGTGNSPLMEGFTSISPATLYNKGKGYGIKTSNALRAFDALQPEPLYQDYICMESAGFAVDLPNGKYRVFINIDNPSGYWGEYQLYHNRSIVAQGKEVVNETMSFDQFKEKYFRYWSTEDLPSSNTFDKYQKAYFQEKKFEVEVTNGQLNLDFHGDSCAASVSTIIIYPLTKETEGEQFLKWVENKRHFYFDNYFKRTLHTATGDVLNPSKEDQARGYVIFNRDLMKDVFYNDKPFKDEIDQPLIVNSFAGQLENLTFSVLPLQDLGSVTVKIADLVGVNSIIPATAIEVGYVSNRISRVTPEGTLYTINPRVIMPVSTLGMPKNITRRFWVTIKTPIDAKPGLYQGKVTLFTEIGAPSSVPIELRVRKGTLDPLDIPVGPFGYTINIPWFDEAQTNAFNRDVSLKSLLKLREYGFTMISGMPTIYYKGFKDGQPILDFDTADTQMQTVKELGFLAVNSYGSGLIGLNSYIQDDEQMKNSGISDYSAFIKEIYSAIQKHADENHWIPIYWNLADEPLGEDLERSIINAESYRKAFPTAPPFFSGASSFQGSNQSDPHFKLGKAFHVANLNNHDEPGINLLHEAGSDWAFYNGGNRWTFGEYLYKAAKQFGLKFRLSWHLNLSAGDPYYALDSREDDYAWFHTTPNAQLIKEVSFERIAAGLVDYRMILTLQRLINEHKGSQAATRAEQLISKRLSAFKLGQRDHDQLYPILDWLTFRAELEDAIESFQQ